MNYKLWELLEKYKILSKYERSTHLFQIAFERTMRYVQKGSVSAQKMLMIFYF